jgi:NAD(P)-dependent dehydrogenase (short-subunit alcohol dehydrogenase family)
MKCDSRKRVCLLTGASGRFGTAFCRLLAEKYDIAAVSLTRSLPVPSQHKCYVDPLDPCAPISENLHPVFTIQADLRDDNELERIVALVLARFDRVDLLVNAAAYYSFGPLESRRFMDTVQRQFDVNVLAPIKLCSVVARQYWQTRYSENTSLNRNIVNVSSIAGSHVYPGGQSIYSASKAALNQVTRHMAEELKAFGVRANALAPNTFPTIVALQTVVDSIVRFDSDMMTGKVLIIDRGGERWC